MTGYLEFYRMSLLHILQSIISRCVTRCRKIFVCAWIVLLICLKTPETAKKKSFQANGWRSLYMQSSMKNGHQNKNSSFFVVSKLEFSFSHTSSWVSFFYCRSLSHSFFNVSIVCQVPPWGPHLTSSLLIISCLIDVLYLLLFVLLVFKGPLRDPTHLLKKLFSKQKNLAKSTLF